MASAWAKPGAWALDSEENEAELLHQHKQDSIDGHSVGSADAADFPSLAAAAATKPKKKKKGQILSLHEFTTYKGPTPDELLNLPTAPRQRSAEELDRNRLGGGFRSYGSSYDRPSRDEYPRRQSSFGSDSNRDFASSRADETDNWAAGKKSMVNDGFDGRRRGDRGGFFSDSPARADEADNWASKKTFAPSEPRRYEKKSGFGFESNNGGADSESWTRKRDDGPRIGGAFDSLRDRRGGLGSESNNGNSDTWGRKREEGNNGPSGGSATRPRLNLQPRTKPIGEEQKSDNGNVAKPKGNNPFGEARPREEVLKENGQDLREIEEKLESTKINGSAAPKGGFWGGNGRERVHQEEKAERTWRKPDSVNPRPESAENTENGSA